MDAIRRSVLRGVDRTVLAGMNAGKIFGFLGSGRESVDIDEDPVAPSVGFRDLADEGWPSFRVPLPPGAVFRYAGAGPLTRVGLWQVPGTRAQIADELERRHGDLRFDRLRAAWEAELPDNVSLRIVDAGNDDALLMVRQQREPEAIVDVIRARGG